MATPIELIYWDAVAILSALDSDDPFHDETAQILEEISNSNGKQKVVTSTFSKIEVSYFQSERNSALDKLVEQTIDAFWADDSLIELIELSDAIAVSARTLVRHGVVAGGVKIRPKDAIHLASAMSVNAQSLYTYDKKFLAYGRTGSISIERPHLLKPRLPGIR